MGNFAYDDPAGIIAGFVVLEILTILCVALRFYSRGWKGQRIITSDWLILAAFIIGTGLTVLEIYGVKVEALGYPLGATIEDPGAVTERLNKAKHIELSYLLLGIAAVGLIKLSATFFYWHLFAQVNPKLRRLLIVWMVIIILWTTSFILAGLLECGSHLTALFGQPQEYLDYCGSAIPSGWAMVGTDIATDVITLIIPIPVVLRLQVSTYRKVLTLLTFMVAAFSVAAGIVKSYIYITASLGLYTEDAISILTGISVWNLVEVQVGIIAACSPTLRTTFSRLFATDGLITSKLWSYRLQNSEQTCVGTGDRSMFKEPSHGSQMTYYESELMNVATKPNHLV